MLIPAIGGVIYAIILGSHKKEFVFCVFDKILLYLPLYLAKKKGFFSKRGINIEIIPGFSDFKTWKSVENGEAHFGLSDPVVMFQGERESGRLIATLVKKVAIWGISKKQFPFIHKIEDFPDNVSICGYDKPSTTACLMESIRKVKNNIELHYCECGKEENAIQCGDNDIVLVPEPIASEWICKKGYSLVFEGPSIYDNISWSGIFVTKEFINKEGAYIEKVLEAIQEALIFIKDNPLEAMHIAEDEFSEFDTFAVYMAVLIIIRQGIFPDKLATNKAEWGEALKLWGYDEKSFRYSQYVENKFADKAYSKFR